MLDGVLVERVGACIFVARQELQLIPRDEPHERAFWLADGAVAGRRTVERSFDLERDAAAMAASLVEYSVSPMKVRATVKPSA